MLLFTDRRPLCRCHTVLAIVISDISGLHLTFAFWAGHSCALGLCCVLRLSSGGYEREPHSPDECECNYGQNSQRDFERLSCHVNLPFDPAYCAIGWFQGSCCGPMTICYMQCPIMASVRSEVAFLPLLDGIQNNFLQLVFVLFYAPVVCLH